MTVAVIITTVIFKWVLFLLKHYIALATMLFHECNPGNWVDNFKEAFADWDPTEILKCMGGFGQSLLDVLNTYGNLGKCLGQVADVLIDGRNAVVDGIKEGVANLVDEPTK